MEPDGDICSLIADPQYKEASDDDTDGIVEMERTQKILTRSNNLKTAGDDFFEAGNYCMAAKSYDKALQFLCHIISLNEDEALSMKESAIALNSNIAACWLKLNEFELAKSQCTSALKLNAGSVKNLYLRALASLNLGLVEESYIDLQEAYKIEPTNLDVAFELKRVEKVRGDEFDKSWVEKGKEISEFSLHHCEGDMCFDPLSSERTNRSLGHYNICSTSKLMEEEMFSPSLSSSNFKMNPISVNMDCRNGDGNFSLSLREASMGFGKDPFTSGFANLGLSSPTKKDGISVRNMFTRYSLKRGSRYFLNINQDDYKKLCRGSELKYFSSHDLVVMTIRVRDRSLSTFENGHIRSNSKSNSFVTNSLPSDDLPDLSGQGCEEFEWNEFISKEMGIVEDNALDIDVIGDADEHAYASSPSSIENTSVKSTSASLEECPQASFRFTSQRKKGRRRKPWPRISLFGMSNSNIGAGSKRKLVRGLSSKSCSPTRKKIALDHTSLQGAPAEGSLCSNYGPSQTNQCNRSKESIFSELYKLEEISKDLVSDSSQLISQRDESVSNDAPEGFQNNDYNLLPSQRDEPMKIEAPEDFQNEGGSLTLDTTEEDDISFGQTLRGPLRSLSAEKQLKHQATEELNNKLRLYTEGVKVQESIATDKGAGSCLSLEVVTGPAFGIIHSVQSKDASKLPLTLGRVPPSDLVLTDSEVSGKHAMINWNSSKLKWELVDIGSLNGTLLNSKAIHHPDTGSRHWGEPMELVNGDVITLGTSSRINVQITSVTESKLPFRVGIASDPMSMRHGGKKLPMEDVCYYQWPLPGTNQFGVFGICDGHGGARAAKSASNIIPEMVGTILSDSSRREKVLSQQDASDVLSDAFSRTEACLDHYYEGCTATVLLVWSDGCSFFGQCANVGDSTCVININEEHFKMTEDHRLSSYSERQRINETGDPLKDGDTRLCGLNLGRMLGDKFLKEQDVRFSSNPYISQVIRIDRASEAFALLASDGLWDVISVKKAIQFVRQAKEKYGTDGKDSAEKIAKFLLNEAKSLRTKDNTSVFYIDFNNAIRTSCIYDS